MTAPARPTVERLWTVRRAPFLVAVLSLMTFIAFEAFAVTTVLPVAMADLDGVRWYSLAYAGTITAALVGMIIAGPRVDRHGPRRLLVVGGTLFVLGVALSTLAPDAPTFILGRLIQGLGGGMDSVVLYVLIARHVPERLRARMFGLLTVAWLLPSIVGPVAAGGLADLTSWRTVFGMVFVGATASLLGLLAVTGRDEQRPGASPRTGDRRIVATLAAAAALVALHVGASLEVAWARVMIGVALLVLVISASRVLPSGTLRLRGRPQRLIALRALLGAAVTGTNVYLTLNLQTARGLSPTAAGVVIAIGALGWALGAWFQGWYPTDRGAHVRLVRVAAVLVAVGPATVLAYALELVPLAAIVVASIVMGTGMGMGSPRISSATLELVNDDEHGRYSSALQSGESMAMSALLAVLASVLTVSATSALGFPVVYGLCLAVAVSAIAIARAA